MLWPQSTTHHCRVMIYTARFSSNQAAYKFISSVYNLDSMPNVLVHTNNVSVTNSTRFTWEITTHTDLSQPIILSVPPACQNSPSRSWSWRHLITDLLTPCNSQEGQNGLEKLENTLPFKSRTYSLSLKATQLSEHALSWHHRSSRGRQ